MSKIHAALEIGTSRTVLAVGETQAGGRMKILSHAEIPSSGVRKSQIIDISQATQSIRSVLREIEAKQDSTGGNVEIHNALLVASGQHIHVANAEGNAVVAGGRVGDAEIMEAARRSREMPIPKGRELLDIVDQDYQIDSLVGITSPKGMSGRMLRLNTLQIHASSDRIQDARTAAEGARLEISEPVFAATCTADAVLEEHERRNGVLVLDLGGGSTGYAAYCDGYLAAAGVVGVGGDHVRMLHPARVDRANLLDGEAITEDMLAFLETCLRYGVSFVVAGRTSSGKTTLLNSLLGSIPDNKRIYTIESGARELSLVKRDEQGRVINNVVHTLSRPSDNATYDVSQEDLVMAALRFDPDVICVGEMRDKEAHSAVEASSTDHTVVTTVHGGGGRFAHRRIAFLSQRRFPIDMQISMQQVALAFPIVVFAHKLEDNTRKVMDISECIVHDDGELEYRTLYRYKIHSNEYVDGQFHIVGEFVQENSPSESLRAKLMRGGIPQELLKRFERKEESV